MSGWFVTLLSWSLMSRFQDVTLLSWYLCCRLWRISASSATIAQIAGESTDFGSRLWMFKTIGRKKHWEATRKLSLTLFLQVGQNIFQSFSRDAEAKLDWKAAVDSWWGDNYSLTTLTVTVILVKGRMWSEYFPGTKRFPLSLQTGWKGSSSARALATTHRWVNSQYSYGFWANMSF